MEWISVEDRLPDNERRVAIVYKYKDSNIVKTYIGEYNPFEKRWINTLDDITITHWMPLPKPPEQ